MIADGLAMQGALIINRWWQWPSLPGIIQFQPEGWNEWALNLCRFNIIFWCLTSECNLLWFIKSSTIMKMKVLEARMQYQLRAPWVLTFLQGLWSKSIIGLGCQLKKGDEGGQTDSLTWGWQNEITFDWKSQRFSTHCGLVTSYDDTGLDQHWLG